MNTHEVGDFLKSLRKSKGLTQAELADMINVSNKTISKWESGLGLPEISTLLILADLYDITVDDILRGSKKMQKSEDKAIHRYEYIYKKTKYQYQNHLMINLGILGLSIVLLFGLGGATYNSTLAMAISLVLIILAMFLQFFTINKTKYQVMELDNDQKEKTYRFVFHTSYFIVGFALLLSYISIAYNVGAHAIPTYEVFFPIIVSALAGVVSFSIINYWFIRFILRLKFLRKPKKITIFVHISLLLIFIAPWILLSFISAKDLAVYFQLNIVSYSSYDINVQENQYFELKLVSIIDQAQANRTDVEDIFEIIDYEYYSTISYVFIEPKPYIFIEDKSYLNSLIDRSMDYFAYEINDQYAIGYWTIASDQQIIDQVYAHITLNLLGILQFGLFVGYAIYFVSMYKKQASRFN